MSSQENRFTIGSDPEFVLVEVTGRNREFIPACRVALARGTSTHIGTDGCASVGELRPEPATDPILHFRKIKALITISRRRYVRDTWMRRLRRSTILEMRAGNTGAANTPLGGHIHFGTPSTPEIAKALDQYLSIPLLFIEEPQYIGRRRAEGHYGQLARYENDSIRTNQHGFEYRTPASWIIEPDITLGVLTLAYTIVWEAKFHPENIEKFLINNIAFKHGNLSFLKRKLPKIFAKIKSMELYPQYKKPINKLLRRVKEQRHWDETSDVWANWLPKRVIERQAAPPKHKLFIFKEDDFLADIATQVTNPQTTEPSITIFGWASNRAVTEYGVTTNSPKAMTILAKTMDTEISTVTRDSSRVEIGFHYGLRSNPITRTKIIEALNEIARKVK